jgi:hypothetical protein
MTRYDVFLINFGYVCGTYKTLAEAVAKGKDTGFQFMINKVHIYFDPVERIEILKRDYLT